MDEAGTVSYATVEARSNQVAHRLRGAGVGPGSIVGPLHRQIDRDDRRAARDPQGRRGVPAAQLRASAGAPGAPAARDGVAGSRDAGEPPRAPTGVRGRGRLPRSRPGEPRLRAGHRAGGRSLAGQPRVRDLHVGLDRHAERRRRDAQQPRELRACDQRPPRRERGAARVRDGDRDLHRSRQYRRLPGALHRRDAGAREPRRGGRRCGCGRVPSRPPGRRAQDHALPSQRSARGHRRSGRAAEALARLRR